MKLMTNKIGARHVLISDFEISRFSTGALVLCCVWFFILMIPTKGYAQQTGVVPESGSPLRLVSVEDGVDYPKLYSDGGVLASGVLGVLGGAYLSWQAHGTKTNHYTGAPLVDIGLAVTATNVTTFALKSVVRRTRPYGFSPNYPSGEGIVYSEAQQDDVRNSFPSGHTSNTAAFLFGLATSAVLSTPDYEHKELVSAGLFTLTAIGTGFVGMMRVRGGYHFTSDVIAGGLIGAGFGIGLPVLHHRFLNNAQRSKANGQGSQASIVGVEMKHNRQVFTFSGAF